MGAVTDWATCIKAARAACIAAVDYQEQTIRDAVADDYPITRVAEDLGRRNRNSIYGALDRGRTGELANPPACPLVYLRGAGRKDSTWAAVEQAMWMRGWRTVRVRTDAWHYARSGSPVVLVDFTAGLDYPVVGCVHVARVRAVYGDDGELRLSVTSRSAPAAPRPAELPDMLALLVRRALDGLLDEPTRGYDA